MQEILTEVAADRENHPAVLGACLSGAGPSILLICDAAAEAAGGGEDTTLCKLKAALAARGILGDLQRVTVHQEGIKAPPHRGGPNAVTPQPPAL